MARTACATILRRCGRVVIRFGLTCLTVRHTVDEFTPTQLFMPDYVCITGLSTLTGSIPYMPASPCQCVTLVACRWNPLQLYMAGSGTPSTRSCRWPAPPCGAMPHTHSGQHLPPTYPFWSRTFRGRTWIGPDLDIGIAAWWPSQPPNLGVAVTDQLCAPCICTCMAAWVYVAYVSTAGRVHIMHHQPAGQSGCIRTHTVHAHVCACTSASPRDIYCAHS